MQVFAFQAVLVPYGPDVAWPTEPVLRTIAVQEDQTLEQLHEALRLAFAWADPHMYAFWMSGRWWDAESVRYQTPDESGPDDDRVRSGRTALSELGLRKGKALAYLFDFGDEWRVLLKVVTVGRRARRRIRCSSSQRAMPPPQYAPLDEGDIADGAHG